MKWTYTVFLLLLPLTLFSNDSLITGVFVHPVSRYFDMDMDANNNEFDTADDFIDDIIEIVSGMIYGWKFQYIPSDIKREIKEEFILEPIAVIKKGDPNMDFRDKWVKDYIMYLNISYRLADFQKKYIDSWNTTLIPNSNGEGTNSIYEDNGKSLSLKEAIKDSIKKEFQSRGKDKPRNIEGQILLRENPRLFINSGQYNTQVKTLILYKDIKEYKYH